MSGFESLAFVVLIWTIGFCCLDLNHWFGLPLQFPEEDEGTTEEKEEVGPCTGQEGLARHQQEGLVPFVSKYIEHQEGLARHLQEGLVPFVSQYIDHQERRWLVINRRGSSHLLVSILTIKRGDG